MHHIKRISQSKRNAWAKTLVGSSY